MSYHKADWDKYITRRMNLAGEKIESLTKYFQNDFDQKKTDGTLKRQEMDRVRNCAQRRVVEEQCRGHIDLSSCCSQLSRCTLCVSIGDNMR